MNLHKIITIISASVITFAANTCITPNNSIFNGYALNLSLGDVNGDGLIDADDASFILSEYSVVSTGNESLMDPEQKKAADLNADSLIDADDASALLSYYSYVSTGGSFSMEQYLESGGEKSPDVTTSVSDSHTPETTVATTEAYVRAAGITLSQGKLNLTVGSKDTVKATVVPENASNKNLIWSSSDESTASVDGSGTITANRAGTAVITAASADAPDVCAKITVNVKSKITVKNGITYVNDILIANKTYGLPSTYNPGGLNSPTSAAFEKLSAGAAKDGLNIYISSGFRSYNYQKQIYNNNVSLYGKAKTDTFSARPGHSEHQTGMAIDVNIISDAFIGTPEAVWLEKHCYEYGFIIRYPKGKQDITGYKYEPWHIRFIGVKKAKAFHQAAEEMGDLQLTLEEYLGIDSQYKS